MFIQMYKEVIVINGACISLYEKLSHLRTTNCKYFGDSSFSQNLPSASVLVFLTYLDGY